MESAAALGKLLAYPTEGTKTRDWFLVLTLCLWRVSFALLNYYKRSDIGIILSARTVIVIPIYKDHPSNMELSALIQCAGILKKYDLCFITHNLVNFLLKTAIFFAELFLFGYSSMPRICAAVNFSSFSRP